MAHPILSHVAHRVPHIIHTPAPTPTTLHVAGTISVLSGSIQTTLPTLDSVLQLVLVVATVGLAIFTAFLFASTRDVARRTGEVARDTLASAALADRHHQESLLPVPIVLSGSLRYVEFIRSNLGLYQRLTTSDGRKLDVQPEQTLEPKLKLYLVIKNIGLGPALNAKLFVSSTGFGTLTRYLGNIGVPRTNEDVVYVDMEVATVERQDLRPDHRLPADVSIEFENVFTSPGSAKFKLGPEGVAASEFKPPASLDRGVVRTADA